MKQTFIFVVFLQAVVVEEEAEADNVVVVPGKETTDADATKHLTSEIVKTHNLFNTDWLNDDKNWVSFGISQTIHFLALAQSVFKYTLRIISNAFWTSFTFCFPEYRVKIKLFVDM